MPKTESVHPIDIDINSWRAGCPVYHFSKMCNLNRKCSRIPVYSRVTNNDFESVPTFFRVYNKSKIFISWKITFLLLLFSHLKIVSELTTNVQLFSCCSGISKFLKNKTWKRFCIKKIIKFWEFWIAFAYLLVYGMIWKH